MISSQHSHIDIGHHGLSCHENTATWYFRISAYFTSAVTLCLTVEQNIFQTYPYHVFYLQILDAQFILVTNDHENFSRVSSVVWYKLVLIIVLLTHESHQFKVLKVCDCSKAYPWAPFACIWNFPNRGNNLIVYAILFCSSLIDFDEISYWHVKIVWIFKFLKIWDYNTSMEYFWGHLIHWLMDNTLQHMFAVCFIQIWSFSQEFLISNFGACVFVMYITYMKAH